MKKIQKAVSGFDRELLLLDLWGKILLLCFGNKKDLLAILLVVVWGELGQRADNTGFRLTWGLQWFLSDSPSRSSKIHTTEKRQMARQFAPPCQGSAGGSVLRLGTSLCGGNVGSGHMFQYGAQTVLSLLSYLTRTCCLSVCLSSWCPHVHVEEARIVTL